MKTSVFTSIQLVSAGALSLLSSPVFAATDNTTINIKQPSGGITNFSKLLTSGVQLAIGLAAILTFAFLIWGGIEWITSGGDKAKYEAARNRITSALVGLAIVAAAWAIMTLVGKFVGLDPFNFNVPTASGD